MTNVVFVGEFLWWVGGEPNLVISDELIKNRLKLSDKNSRWLQKLFWAPTSISGCVIPCVFLSPTFLFVCRINVSSFVRRKSQMSIINHLDICPLPPEEELGQSDVSA